MGVRGLQYFIENVCPDACINVSIQQLADIHRKRYNCQPVLVIDGMALINRFYSKNFEWIYGGQWRQFIEKLEQLISIFDNIGVKLVFFFDGTVCASKRREWVKRRVSKYQQIISIFYELETNFHEPDHKLFQLPTSMGTLTRFALKELGAEVYQTNREADEVIADYANKNFNVFAILSQDSDFIIYNTKTYLSLMHLDLDSLMTIHYDRDCFALRYLHLRVNQLPLFACLAGNDIIPSGRLKYFHKYLSNHKNGRSFMSDIAQNLATIITKEHWTGDFNNQEELDHISVKVCGNSSLSCLIHNGLVSYSTDSYFTPPKVSIELHRFVEKEIHEKHLNCSNAPFIFNLLCNMEYESSEVLEDASRLPSALVYRKIRQRCYGVLFNYYSSNKIAKDGRPILIKEWCAYQGNIMEKPEYIQPLPLEFPVHLNHKRSTLNLENLWFQYTDVEKFILFWSILEIPLQFELLLNLPKHYIVLVCVINYLIQGLEAVPLLKPLEVVVFIIQALWKLSTQELQMLQVPWVDPAAVSLSTLFMRGVTTILMVLNTCGNPFPIKFAMPWYFFDGKLFHYIHIKAKGRPFIQELCNQKVDVIKEFYWLLPIVTNNTMYAPDRFNWMEVLGDFDIHQIKM